MPEAAIIGPIVLLFVFLFAGAIAHSRRHDHVHFVLGIDMRGFDSEGTYAEKIGWIKSRPDFKPHHKASDVLIRWEKRDSELDKKVS